MAQSKKNKSSIFQKMVDIPFIDFDSCAFCNSHNGPFVWTTFDNGNHEFLCEECYEAYKEMREKVNKIYGKPLG